MEEDQTSQLTSQCKLFNTDDLQLSPELSKKIEETKFWNELYRRVSPDTYTARTLLYVFSKSQIPLFLSKPAFRIKYFIAEMENKFMSPNIREEFIKVYCKLMRTYWGFATFARIWKIRKIPIRIKTDLYMNELDQNDKNTFQLINKNGIYLFSLQNLARIIVDAITHQNGMFVEPLTIKNPYTNDLLSKCDLFNIYLSLRQYNIRIHEMMEKFFQCEFNIFEFQRKYETELRDYGIEQYAKTASVSELTQDIDDMLRVHHMKNKIKISPGFPQKKLVECMRPLLKTYLLERYSFSSVTRKYSAKKLDYELKNFAERNPLYGRRLNNEAVYVSNPFSKTNIVKYETKYVTEVIAYPKYCASQYMKTHVPDDETFDRYIETGDSIETYYPTELNNEYEDEEQTVLDDVQNNASNTVQDNDTTSENDVIPNTEPHLYVFSPPMTIDVITQIGYVDPPQRTFQQIRENALAILTRLGQLSSNVINTTSTINNNTANSNNNINDSSGVGFLSIATSTDRLQRGLSNNTVGDLSSRLNNNQLNGYNDENDEEEEEEEEEVINNTESEEEDQSYIEWDEEDSIS